MRFYNYLTESRISSMDKESAFKMIKKDYGEALKNFFDGYAIWRGTESNITDYGKMDLSGTRQSANTGNFYTLIINNDISWKKFPKRKLICSSNFRTADSYGIDTFLVFPPDNARIGVCSSDDIWDSFNLEDLSDADEVNIRLRAIFDDLGFYLPKIESDFESFKEACSQIKKNDKNFKAISKSNELADMFFDSNYKNLYDFLVSEIFTPKNFKVTNTNNYKVKGDHEVWIDEDPIVINYGGLTIGEMQDLRELNRLIN